MRINFTLFNRDSVRRVLLTCLVLFTAIGASAYSFSADNEGTTIYYNITTSTSDASVYGEVEVTCENDYSYGAYSGSVTIPETVTYRGYTYKVTSIGNEAFQECYSLESVDLSGCTYLTTIGNSAFSSCTDLSTITLPSNLTSLGTNAFTSCTSLGSITLPSTVTTIGAGAFSSCTSVKTITIPEGVITIGASTFLNSNSLTSVTLPSTLTSIGNYAFYLCSSLTQVVSLATSAPTCSGSSTFTNVPSTCVLYVPEGSKSDYTSKNYWSTYFADNTEEITPITIGSVGVTAYSHVQTTESTYLPDFSNVLDLGDSQSVKAYAISKVSVATDTSGDLVGTATMTEFTETLADGEGLIIESVNSGACTVYAVVNESTDAETVSDDNNDEATTNYLKATTGETLKNAYVFGYFQADASDLGFYYFNSIDVEEGKAYLPGDILDNLSSQVKSILFVYDDGTDSETTGISEISTSAPAVNDNVYYNLSGMRVKTPTKGIYIVNGKKVIIK